MGFDFGGLLKYSISEWARDKKTLTYFAILAIILFIVNVATSFFAGGLFGQLANAASLQPAEILAVLMSIFAYFAVIFVLVWLVCEAISYMVIQRILFLNKRKPVALSLNRYLRFLVLSIAQALSVIFSVFDPKMLLILAAGIVLLIIGAAGLALSIAGNMVLSLVGALVLLISLLLLLVYAIVVIRNAARLILSPVSFIEKEQGIMKSLGASWEKTRGNALNIFLLLLLLGIIFAVISWIVSAPLTIYQFSSMAANSQDPLAIYSQFTSPVALLLGIPGNIVQAVLMVTQLFAIVGVYEALSSPKKLLAKRAVPARKRK